MRKTAILLFFTLALILSSYAQKERPSQTKGMVGITFSSLGTDDLVSSGNLIGGPGYSGDGFFSVGVSYLHPLNQTLDIETGIEYSNYKILINPSVMVFSNYPPYDAKFSLITIPFNLRVNFARYFFVNGGLFLGVDASSSMPVNSQSGIGMNFGLGLKYNFNDRLTAFVNPYIKMHSMVSISTENSDRQRLLESGFRFGLLYQLKYP